MLPLLRFRALPAAAAGTDVRPANGALVLAVAAVLATAAVLAAAVMGAGAIAANDEAVMACAGSFEAVAAEATATATADGAAKAPPEGRAAAPVILLSESSLLDPSGDEQSVTASRAARFDVFNIL